MAMIVGNWKMNTTLDEGRDLVSAIKDGLAHITGAQVVLCPPYISLIIAGEALTYSDILIGAQNLHHEPNGAYTGEVSAVMIAEICQYVIVGHSERRTLFGETDAVVNLKVKAALNAGITPIFCVGESLDERESGNANGVVAAQVRDGLAGVDIAGVVVAYEPVWAIGTGRSASPEIAQTMMAHIRATLVEIGGADAAANTPLLYGGSVNADNIAGYVTQADIDGALVGGASLDADAFVEIVRIAAAAG